MHKNESNIDELFLNLTNNSLTTERVDMFVDKSIELSSADMKLSDLEEKILIFIFSIVIIFGVFGNALVIWTVLFNRQMRTSNNLFVLNLAISDLTLCLFSIPFNVYKTLRHTWKFGSFLCKFSPFFQASNVFISTISITAIALDRYVYVVHSINVRQSNNINSVRSILILLFIWFLAFFLSSPLFLFNRIESILIRLDSENDANYLTNSLNESFSNKSLHLDSNLDSMKRIEVMGTVDESSSLSVIDINHCIENSPFHQSRLIYSYASLLTQYTLPILIVGIAYGSIWWKLKSQRNKLKNHQNINNKNSQSKSKNYKASDGLSVLEQVSNTIQPSCNQINSLNVKDEKKLNTKNIEKRRRLKMNLLLIFIAIIFAASWLPLNIFNILSDSKVTIIKADHSFYIVNAICILFGMSSAVSNPILYGVLNENFKREYKKLFDKLFGNCSRRVNKSISNIELRDNSNNINSNKILTLSAKRSIKKNQDINLIESQNLIESKEKKCDDRVTELFTNI